MTIKGSESEVSDKPIVKVQDKNIIMSSTESSSPSSLPNSPNTTPTENTIPPQVEVRMKPPNNIEFNPPISAENLSTAMEDGISGAGAANDVRELKEKGKEHRKPQDMSQEEKLDEEKKYFGNSLVPPFTMSFALWQQSMLYWIDIFNEFAINAAKTTQYWFNAFRR